MSSLLGWILVYIVSINSKWIASCVEYIGKHSVWILGLHFLSFKIVTMVYLKIVLESKATFFDFAVDEEVAWLEIEDFCEVFELQNGRYEVLLCHVFGFAFR